MISASAQLSQYQKSPLEQLAEADACSITARVNPQTQHCQIHTTRSNLVNNLSLSLKSTFGFSQSERQSIQQAYLNTYEMFKNQYGESIADRVFKNKFSSNLEGSVVKPLTSSMIRIAIKEAESSYTAMETSYNTAAMDSIQKGLALLASGSGRRLNDYLSEASTQIFVQKMSDILSQDPRFKKGVTKEELDEISSEMALKAYQTLGKLEKHINMQLESKTLSAFKDLLTNARKHQISQKILSSIIEHDKLTALIFERDFVHLAPVVTEITSKVALESLLSDEFFNQIGSASEGETLETVFPPDGAWERMIDPSMQEMLSGSVKTFELVSSKIKEAREILDTAERKNQLSYVSLRINTLRNNLYTLMSKSPQTDTLTNRFIRAFKMRADVLHNEVLYLKKELE